jgi:hypothetical protein
MKDVRKIWNDVANKTLLNRKIVEVRYLTEKESELMGWGGWCGISFTLDNGQVCMLSSDDEGNRPGSLFYGKDGVLPIILESQ